jgi:hypothetical protein
MPIDNQASHRDQFAQVAVPWFNLKPGDSHLGYLLPDRQVRFNRQPVKTYIRQASVAVPG